MRLEAGYNGGKNRVTRNTWLRLCIQFQSSCWSLGNCSRDSRELKDEVTPRASDSNSMRHPHPPRLPLPRYGLTFIFMYESCCSRKHRQCCTTRAHRDDKIKYLSSAEMYNFIWELHLDHHEYLFYILCFPFKLYIKYFKNIYCVGVCIW